MINKNNIKEYIQFLYKMKYSTDAPEQLVSKWASLNSDEIKSNLVQLYEHWGFDAEKIKATEINFLKIKEPVIKGTTTPYTKPVQNLPPVKNTSKQKPIGKILAYTIIPLLLIAAGYVFYQYSRYEKLHTIYTLTQNVAIRDEQGKTIGNFGLLASNKPNTYTELIAVDNDIYPLSIDSTDKKYDFRKVLFEKISFMDYLKNNYEYGFVNANYVIEDHDQFEEYKRIFSKFQSTDNNRLKLSQRKIIYYALKKSHHNRGSYLLSSCKNSNKKFSGFISNEIVENTRFQMIAKLEDGYFYSIVGDLNSNEYYQPERIQLDGEDCNSDFLFRYISAEAGYKIYDCSGTPLNIKCNFDENKMISSFETIYTEPESTPDTETEEDGGSLFDAIFN